MPRVEYLLSAVFGQIYAAQSPVKVAGARSPHRDLARHQHGAVGFFLL